MCMMKSLEQKAKGMSDLFREQWKVRRLYIQLNMVNYYKSVS